MWQHHATLPWQSPMDVAQAYAHADMTLLYSSLENAQTGQFSYLLHTPLARYSGKRWEDLPAIPADAPPDLPYYVGYLGYETGDHVPPPDEPGVLGFPLFLLVRYAHLLRFDHQRKLVEEWYNSSSPLEGEQNDASVIAASFVGGKSSAHHLPPPTLLRNVGSPARGELGIGSNFTRSSYEECVRRTIARIEAGDFYQANITRKFWGELPRNDTPDHFALFTKLCELSPAPYSAYIRDGHRAILSSSPECFLTIDAGGAITTRPIKGSAARCADVAEDKHVRESLAKSLKNLAENLMITDLMRHDLAQVSEVGSVNVAEQSGLYSYRTIHHLVSTITAQKRVDVSAYDAVRACFPPGSMTGAPKIAAMRWCAAQERLPRGVYSGAVGWFGGGGTAALSVVIRTLLCEGNRFEFQVGGGIVADSDPADEWRETLAKARAIAEVLGISEEALANI